MIAIDDWERATCGPTRRPSASRVSIVSPGFFEALGVPPAAGRTFTAEEARHGQDHRVILERRALAAGASAARPMRQAARVTLNAEAYEVVGIAPPEFQFPDGAQAWVPLRDARAGRGPARSARPDRPGPAGRRPHGGTGAGRAGRGREAARGGAPADEHRTRRSTSRSFNLGFGDPGAAADPGHLAGGGGAA